MKTSTTTERVMARIATARPCTTPWHLAADLHLQRSTVDRILDRLVAAGRIELVDDEKYYTPSAAEAKDRAIDTRIRSDFPRTP